MTRLAVILATCAIPALAETVQFNASAVTIRETMQPGAAAELLYENSVHDSPETGFIHLTRDGIICDIEIETGYADPDTIVLDCPGYDAVPHRLTLADGTKGVIYLYPLAKAGM